MYFNKGRSGAPDKGLERKEKREAKGRERKGGGKHGKADGTVQLASTILHPHTVAPAGIAIKGRISELVGSCWAAARRKKRLHAQTGRVLRKKGRAKKDRVPNAKYQQSSIAVKRGGALGQGKGWVSQKRKRRVGACCHSTQITDSRSSRGFGKITAKRSHRSERGRCGSRCHVHKKKGSEGPRRPP